MGLFARMSTLMKAKTEAFLDKAEDTGQMLDYSYEKQLELLQNVKRGVVDVTTAKRRLELQEEQLKENAAKFDGQARAALAAGREDLTRTALERKQAVLVQIQDLEGQIAGLQNEQDKLTAAESRLAAKVEAFRTHKETIKAQYSAAEAEVKIGEAATGISEEMSDVGLTIQRANDKTEKMRARAGAIDELIAAGTLEDFTGSSDVVDQELVRISSSQNVEQELARLRTQLQGPQQQQQLEGKKE
ncbi:MAG: PspA/IM30 family protein [Chloroflexi bacterium]|nr:PspA/IM30 family protein [Chloroflexota bacterium]